MLHFGSRVCPWWLSWTFDNPLRRFLHPPDRIARMVASPGRTVMDVGCGMGYFSIPLAREVGEHGRVIALDVQERMLEGLRARAERSGVEGVVRPRLSTGRRFATRGSADGALAFWMLHEVPDRTGLLRQLRAAIATGGRLLVVEPVIHVSRREFEQTVSAARGAGFRVVARPRIFMSRAVLFRGSDAARRRLPLPKRAA